MKNIRYILMVAILLVSGAAVHGRGVQKERAFPRFTFGMESNYISTFLAYRHFNFISGYGYRIDRRTWSPGYHSNGELLFHAGCNVSENVNLSIYAGYTGINKYESIHPLTLRCTYYFGKEPASHRWLAFIDAGSGADKLRGKLRASAIGKLGAGYRISLSRFSKLDFLAAVKGVYTNPNVSEGYGSGYVTGDRLRRNNAYYLSVTFGIGLTF